ncbi:hypothetical protein AC578_10092 [Pseudocercospora eumusae]|uniref:RING-type domain-containing protein n=1 Tax=Pseudocercospora eumusae TaxID=321146 RepID=A0A139GWU8_9PEZI|nr:hypothetical protein AC578_10092 [Pseudocercospora eumusae]
MSRRSDFPLPSQDSQETRDRRPRPPPLPFPPMTPNAPQAGSHLGQLLQATGVRPYDTRIVTPTSYAHQPNSPHRRPESSPLSNVYRTRTIEPDNSANVDTDHDFDRFIDTDDLEYADLPGLPGSFNTRSYTPPAPNSLSRLQNALGHRELPHGPPPSPTPSDNAMDAINFQPTMPPSSSVLHDRAPGQDLEQELEAAIPGPRLQFNPAATNIEDRLPGTDPENSDQRLVDQLIQQTHDLETRLRRRGDGRIPPAADHTVRTLRALLQSFSDPPVISVHALPLRHITVADQDEDGYATCSICREHVGLGTAVTQLSCSHWFCTGCLEPWLHRRTCPACRATISG